MCAACGGGGGEAAVPPELVGTYEAELPGRLAAMRIAIGADRSFRITLPGRTRPFSVGPIDVTDERVVVSADEAGDCTKRGTYEYGVAGDRLTLEAVGDPCTERADGLGRMWTRSAAVPPSVAERRRMLEAFRRRRNAVCERRDREAAEVNATAAQAGEASALRRGADVMRRTQADLDALRVPPPFAAFVEANRASRQARIRLHLDLAAAYDDGDQAAAGRLGRELVAGNVIPGEQLEDRYFLSHCP